MKNMSFEDAVAKLEKIASDIEDNKLSLDETIKKYEEGTKLCAMCNKMIDDANQRITILSGTKDGIYEKEFVTEGDQQ